MKAPDGTPPETFQPKVRKQNQIGFWNISSRLTSAASFIEIGLPPFATSGTLSQTMTLNTSPGNSMPQGLLYQEEKMIVYVGHLAP